MPPESYTTREAVARALYLIIVRGGLATGEVAKEIGYSERGARDLLNAISRVVPLTLVDGRWYVILPRDLEIFPQNSPDCPQ